MRRLLVLPALAFATCVTLCAQSPSGSAQETFAVSVEVVRPCSIDANGGSANVTCGHGATRSQTTPGSNTAKPVVSSEPTQGTDSTVTVEF